MELSKLDGYFQYFSYGWGHSTTSTINLLLPSHEMSNQLSMLTTHLLKSQQHSIVQAHTHWLISTFSCPAFAV
jgi:hypothetical protein